MIVYFSHVYFFPGWSNILCCCEEHKNYIRKSIGKINFIVHIIQCWLWWHMEQWFVSHFYCFFRKILWILCILLTHKHSSNFIKLHNFQVKPPKKCVTSKVCTLNVENIHPKIFHIIVIEFRRSCVCVEEHDLVQIKKNDIT